MEAYQEVNTREIKSVTMKRIPWKPLLRQILVCGPLWTFQFMCGLSFGSPTVFIPQIRKEANSTEAITPEMASWMSSAFSFGGLFFVFLLSFLMLNFGRRRAFLVSVIISLISFISLYCSNSVITIIISLMLQGVLSACQIIVSVVILTEYTSPRYRGIFLAGKTPIFYWGLWVANAVGTFFHWRNIALIGIVCSLYPLVSVFLWTESPYWLASRGKFKECAESLRWLKGSNVESEKELEELLKYEERYLLKRSREKPTVVQKVNMLYITIKSKEFHKPILISCCTALVNLASGKIVTAVYAIDIIKKITGNESTAYTAMLILDGITIVSMYVGCVMSKFITRRAMLLVSSSIGVIFLFIIALYLYLVKLAVVSEDVYVSVGLLILFNIAISFGPLIMSTSIYGELIPLRSRHLASIVIAILLKVSQGTLLKISPSAFKIFGLHGTYLCFGLSSIVFIVILHKYLPETKDKTLQEIAESMLSSSRKEKPEREELNN